MTWFLRPGRHDVRASANRKMGAQVFFNAWERLWVPTCSLATDNVYVGARHSPRNQPLFFEISSDRQAPVRANERDRKRGIRMFGSELPETGVNRAGIIIVLQFSKS